MIRVDFRRCRAQSLAWQKLKPGNRICNAWGRGVGKSWFARVVMYLLVAEWDSRTRQTLDGPLAGVRIVLLFPTLEQFKRIGMAQALLEELASDGRWGFLGAQINRTDWRITFPGGSWIQVVSAQKIDANRGIRCDVLVADECDDIEIADYESVCIPWFSQPWSLNMRMLGGTPRRGRFGLLWRAYRVWPHGDAEREPVPNHYAFHATYRDAPKIVSATTVEEARRTTSPDRFAREWECDFDSGEGLVYPFFSPEFHRREAPPGLQFAEHIVGVDYGFNDPTVFLVIGITGSGRDAIAWVREEKYMVGKSPSELAWAAREIESAYPRARWYADHQPSTTKEIRDYAGVNITEADKGPGSVEDGVAFVADALFVRETDDGRRWAQVYVDPSCKHTIEEFGLYRRRRDPRNADRVLDDIDTSKNDHCMDALRYALYSRFAGPDRRRTVHDPYGG